jgi:hypothetical protein
MNFGLCRDLNLENICDVWSNNHHGSTMEAGKYEPSFFITFAWRRGSTDVFFRQRRRRLAGNAYRERPAARMYEYGLAAAAMD